MGMITALELLIGLVVALLVPGLVWSTVIPGLLKVLRRQASTKRSTPSGSIEV
jgi:hypothetical protein